MLPKRLCILIQGLSRVLPTRPLFFPSHRFLIRHLCMLLRSALALSLYPEFRPWRPRHPLRANVDGLILLALVALRRPI